MAKCNILFALPLIFLAGCSSLPRGERPPDVTVEADPVMATEPAITPAPVPATVTAAVVDPATNPVPAPAPVLPATAASVPANAAELFETWVPLDRWCRANGFTAPRRLTSESSPTYTFASTNGTMIIRVGSQLAWWNDIGYRLGFAPQIIGGHPFVQHLDILKNFMPLLDNPNHARSNHVIVIDPGHGGMDTGTKSVFNGRFEKEYTLDWALRLQALLVTNGWTVRLTRDTDVNLPLSSRVAFAEQMKADVFLSLHLNSAFPDREQSGLETYCLTPSGMPSNLTRGFKDNTLLVFPNNRFDTENMQYAVRLHRALLDVNGHADRGVRRARFLGVLQGQNRPAILVEGGYLSNPKEAQRIADPAYRQRLAEALARALVEDAGGGVNLVSQVAPVLSVTNNLEGKTN